MSRANRELIPWLASGGLEPEERRRLEAELTADPQAAELLQTARLLQEAVDQEEALSSRLLVEYADAPGDLDEEVRRRVEEELSRDPAAVRAVELLRSLPALPVETASPDAGRQARRAHGAAAQLRVLLLRPVPAAVPLLLLLLAGAGLWLTGSEPRPEQPAGRLVQLLRLRHLDTFRSAGATTEVKLPTVAPTGAPLVIELATGLEPSDLRGRELDLVVEGPSGILIRRTVGETDFDDDARLPLLLLPADLETPGPYRIELRYRAPGSPLDGVTAFRSGFVVEAP